MNKKVIVVFQGLRVMAFLLVFVSHCKLGVNAYGANTTKWFGALGVSVFLILSGFLTIYNNEQFNNKFKVIERLKRTLIKFYPLHLVCFVISIPLVMMSNKIDFKYIFISISNVFLVQSWIPKSSFYFSFNDVSWYLSVYIFIVIIGPRISNYIRRLSTVQVIVIVLLIVVIQSILPFIESRNIHWFVYVCPLIRLLDYIIGCCAATICLKNSINYKLSISIFFICIVMIVTLLCFSINTDNELFAVAVWSLPVFGVVLSLYQLRCSFSLNCILGNDTLQYLGEISLEMFLFHKLIIRIMNVVVLSDKTEMILGKYLLSLILTIVFSTLAYRLKKIKEGEKFET